jgi:hypothetical protein
MTAIYNVAGPVRVEVQNPGASTWLLLGYTDNDEMPEIDEEYFTRRHSATDVGAEPGVEINMGMIALINVTLIKWDDAVRQTAFRAPGATAPSSGGTIGSVWGGNYIAIRFVPTIVGQQIKTCSQCFMDGPGSVREMDFGNAGKRLAIQLVAKRGAEGSVVVATEAVSGGG